MAFAWTKDTGGTLNTNFVSAWNLADTTDDKGTETLTNHNSVAFSAGKNGNAADGGATNTNKYLDTGNNPLGTASTTFSISAWVNVTTAPSSSLQYCFYSLDQAGASGIGRNYHMFYGVEGGTKKITVFIDQVGISSSTFAFAVDLSTGTWHHVVMDVSSGAATLWLDGTSEGTATDPGAGNNASNNNFAIVGQADNERFFQGLVDACYFWSKALSSTEVGDLYNGGTGSFYNQSAGGGGATTPQRTLVGIGV